MRKQAKATLTVALVAIMTSACVPKKLDIGIPKDIKLDLSGNTESKFKFAAEELVHANAKKAIDSLSDYTYKELGDLILKSDAVSTVSKLLETKENVECYSDTKGYLKVERHEENHYNYRLSLICFNPKDLPNTDGMSDSDKLSVIVSAVSGFTEGTVSWSNQGLLVTTKNGETPDVSIKPTPLFVLLYARNHLLRITEQRPAGPARGGN